MKKIGFFWTIIIDFSALNVSFSVQISRVKMKYETERYFYSFGFGHRGTSTFQKSVVVGRKKYIITNEEYPECLKCHCWLNSNDYNYEDPPRNFCSDCNQHDRVIYIRVPRLRWFYFKRIENWDY